MASNPKPAFDIGPLSWVKAEIEHSLAETRAHLEALAANPGDTKAAKYAATHLHQVTGALTMVGLGAATRFNEEIEKLVGSHESDPNARAQAPQRIATALTATASLSAYLDSLMAGEPDRPMLLARAYIEVNKARGATDASETDLFSPDLSLTLVMPDNTVALPKPEMLAEAIKQRRAMYQAGLLKLLRDKDMVGGAREMRNATLAIEALQVTSPTVSFWYAASGFFDAVATNPGDAGAMAVQLFGKIDQQIKLLIDGVQKVPEKLFRDLLLVIGRSKANTERLRKIRELYRLDELLAIPVVHGALGADDQLKAVIRGLRDHVQEQKESWLKFASGNRASLEQFVTQSAPFLNAAKRQPNRDLATVVETLGAVGEHLRKTQVPVSETLSLEMATALLFLESALENYFRQSSDFGAQARNVVERLKGAMTGSALPPARAGTSALMDDMSKRAQERMLMFQVGQEVQVNLATIEGSLDTFFRDPTKSTELSNLAPLFSQVQGALTILELNEAADLNSLLRKQVEQFASGAITIVGDDAEAVAEGVSALGLYIAALQQGTSQPRDVLLPALIRFGLAEKPADPDRTAIKSPISKADVDVAKQKVQGLYEDWKQQPEQTASRDQLRAAVKDLRQDATLIADGESARQSDEMLKAIDQTFDPNKTGVMTAIAEIAPDKPTEAPSAQTVQLIDASATEVDSELLEIFLEEAGEVVVTISENLGVLRGKPHDHDALTTIRRGYHTLKGSGRMVGLVDLGEVAWSCEQVFNKWLKDETPASPSLLAFVDHTLHAFSEWVSALKITNGARVDGSAIARMAEMLKNGQEPVFAAEPVAAIPEVASAETPAEPVATPIALSPAPSVSIELPPATTVETSPFEFAAVDAATPVDAEPLVEIASTDETPLAVEAVESPEPAFAPDLASTPEAFELEQELPSDTSDIVVGTVIVPHALFNIYLGEAEQHIATLDNEMAALEAKPERPVSHEFMRAAHTLNSSSRTTNFDMIAEVAAGLEKWSQDAIEFTPVLDAERLGVMRQAVDALSSMVMGLHTHELPTPREDVVKELIGLREALKLAKRAESSFVKLPDATAVPEIVLADEIDFGNFGAIEPSAPATSANAQLAEIDAIEVPAAAPFADFSFPAETPPPIPVAEPVAELEFSAPTKSVGDAAIERNAEAAPVSVDVIAADEPMIETAPESAFDAPDFFDAPAAEAAVEPPVEHVRDFEVPQPAVEVDGLAQGDAVAEPETATLPGVAAIGVAAELASTMPSEVEHSPFEVAVPAPTAPLFVPSPAPAPATTTVVTHPVEAAFESGKEKRRIEDDIDADLLPIFLEEAKEIVPQVGDGLRTWRAMPADHAPVIELARHFHTLKGSARMAGLMRLGELAHVIESRMIAMDAEAEPASVKFDDIDEHFDRFTGALDRLNAGELTSVIEIPVSDVFEHQKDKPTTIAVMAAAAQAVRDESAPKGRERQSLLRVNADIIDRFVNEAGELSIARSRVEQEMLTFKQSLLDLNENIARMKAQLREVEIQSETQIQSRIKEAEEHGAAFDPLEFDRFSRTQELTRFMAESLNDVVTLQVSLQKNLDEAEAALIQQSRLNRDLQQGLMSVRLVPLGNLQDRFYRLVRQTAKELEKKANLEFRGVRVEIDRSVLEKITPPFEHLLRNAVAHGLELPADRAAKGKSEIGEITIDAQQVGNEVVLTLSDDGAGLNFARIREKAIEQGLLAADAEVSEAQLTQFIFMAGFSTAKEVTQVAGRGVGMDVVRNEIVSLGGRIDIASNEGRGTTFTIALPLTLAVTQAVMVVVGDVMYAIPSVMIEQVQEYKGKRYEPLLAMNEIEWKGTKYPLRSMAALLGGKPTVSAQRKALVILAKSGQQRSAVQVDQIIGNREIVVKTIGPQLARLMGVAGATVTGSGQIILIINPVQLHFRETATVSIERAQAMPVGFTSDEQTLASSNQAAVHVLEDTKGQSLGEAIAAAAPAAGDSESATPLLVRSAPLVMVVDDSLTVRKITSRMLLREGFEVATAKDGVDGLQQLQDIEPDIILLDIEMPRMDGFEFARNVRADAKTRGIPIIMITSRTAEKHRNRALELGVNEYMGKPYQEEQLLVMIRNFTKARATA
ncbi:MAG: Hpt domain-containing protein [Betaproteobacteria bacterium]